ncbi:NUDIX hydrolase domain-like protein [Boletus reticuloceps]|uniref:NUDIX hydrolase domain-like protein n=1 Tax=Boletus reticuloceps TaxID=495285 RepID=A0A8I2YVT4_9AGAM|nr:NUDIX hydrolase domain-like protein [Boletus reticuloceps]
MSDPKVLSTEPLDNAHSKFVALTKIHYQDQDGKKRVWECAERKVVQGHTGKDAVAIFAILKSKTDAFPLSTVIIEQYRPPLDKYVIEFPAGLVNAATHASGPDEEAQVAALRELEEETGYKATQQDVVECTPVLACDPGMTTARMRLVVVKVELEDGMEYPPASPDPGEHIVVKVVELAQLKRVLEDYNKKGFIVDARLSHFASGYDIAERIRNGHL